MIRGITPIDAAFELMGLHQAQALTRFIFVETVAGKLVFAAGFISSLTAGLEKGNFRPLGVFLFLFFSFWFLFVMPQATLGGSVSTMEQGGYQQVTTTQILQKAGYAGAKAASPLDLVARWMDTLVSGATAVLDRTPPGKGYLASPFLLTKVSMIASGTLARGITSVELEEETARFYQEYYWPALRRLKKSDASTWPGQESLVSTYKEEGVARWRTLRDKLYGHCDKDQLFDRMFKRFYEGVIDKDAVVRELLRHELVLKPRRYTLMSYDLHPNVATAVPASVSVFQRMVQVLPFVQGGALFLAWSVFPVFLVATVLTRRMRALLLFFACLLSIKAWTFAWAIVDKSAWVWFALNSGWSSAPLWQAPAINVVIVCMAVAAPVVVSAGAWMIFRRM